MRQWNHKLWWKLKGSDLFKTPSDPASVPIPSNYNLNITSVLNRSDEKDTLCQNHTRGQEARSLYTVCGRLCEWGQYVYICPTGWLGPLLPHASTAGRTCGDRQGVPPQNGKQPFLGSSRLRSIANPKGKSGAPLGQVSWDTGLNRWDGAFPRPADRHASNVHKTGGWRPSTHRVPGCISWGSSGKQSQ